jgi:hypothetical protein
MPDFVTGFTKHSSFRYLINEADDDGMNALWVKVTKFIDESKIGSRRPTHPEIHGLNIASITPM